MNVMMKEDESVGDGGWKWQEWKIRVMTIADESHDSWDGKKNNKKWWWWWMNVTRVKDESDDREWLKDESGEEIS